MQYHRKYKPVPCITYHIDTYEYTVQAYTWDYKYIKWMRTCIFPYIHKTNKLIINTIILLDAYIVYLSAGY